MTKRTARLEALRFASAMLAGGFAELAPGLQFKDMAKVQYELTHIANQLAKDADRINGPARDIQALIKASDAS